jgi:aminopeptidase N
MRPARALLAAALVLAACTGDDVSTDSAVRPTSTATASPATTTPPPPTAADTAATTEPATTSPATTDTTAPPTAPPTTAAGDPTEPSLSVGDRLYPELGSADLDVQSYDVALHYDVGAQRIDATVTITAVLDRPLDVIALDAGQLVVDAVTVDGAAATFEQTGTELLVHAPATAPPHRPVEIAVTYHDDQHRGSGPFDIGGGWAPTATGAWVLNEPAGARQWLPSNDTPADKATWRFEVTVPPGLAAVANGHLVEQRPEPDGTTWVWEERAPMATYLVQLLIGDYQIVDGGTVGATTITNAALSEDVGRMQPYFDRTAEQMAYFEGLFGPFPFDHYGLAFADSAGGLAMETLGRSMFRRDERTDMFMSHELAHQWFGDAVTPARWEDVWLNESFATYGQWLWLDHAGWSDIEATAAAFLAARQQPGDPTGAPAGSANLFGFERYDGGAVVLHALRHELGEDAFFTLLRRWAAENAGTSRTTVDFVALADDVAGRDLTAFFDAWLYAAALPPAFPG